MVSGNRAGKGHQGQPVGTLEHRPLGKLLPDFLFSAFDAVGCYVVRQHRPRDIEGYGDVDPIDLLFLEIDSPAGAEHRRYDHNQGDHHQPRAECLS